MAFSNIHIVTTLTEHTACCGDKQETGTVMRTALYRVLQGVLFVYKPLIQDLEAKNYTCEVRLRTIIRIRNNKSLSFEEIEDQIFFKTKY